MSCRLTVTVPRTSGSSTMFSCVSSLKRVLDVRVLEVQRNRLARVLLVPGAESAGLVGIRDFAGTRGTVLLNEKGFGRLDQGLVFRGGRPLATRFGGGNLDGGGDRGRSLDLVELGRGPHEARRVGLGSRGRGRAGRNRGGRRRGRRRHVESASLAHDGFLRIVDFMLLVGAPGRHR